MIELKKLKKLKTAELEAIITQYEAIGPIEGKEEASTNPKRVALIEKCMEVTGLIPVVVTEEFFTLNPDADKEQFKVGNIVLVPKPRELTDEEKAKIEAETKAKAEAEANANANTNSSVSPESKASDDSSDVAYYYKGKIVVKTGNRIVNGRLYKEVFCADSSYLLTEEEFTNEVKPLE